jgi:hypothetical protein
LWLQQNVLNTTINSPVIVRSKSTPDRYDGKLSAYVYFDSAAKAESGGVTYSFQASTRVEGDGAVEQLLRLELDQPGRLSGKIKYCHLYDGGSGGGGGTNLRLSLQLEDPKFVPDQVKAASPPPVRAR